MESLRLFFSYGHEDRNKPIIDLIKDNLVARKHDVWIDTLNIPHASYWRREIQRGINASHGVLAFLSQHAMRKVNGEPGVCLDELSIAVSTPEVTIITILLEPEKEVDAPPTISAIQRLDMSDWKEKYEIGGKEFDEYFESKFALILEAVESDQTFQFHGEIEGLRKSLFPNTDRSRYRELLAKPMIGREWVAEIFNQYMQQREVKRFLCLYGGPGCGKSHFIAHMIHYNPQVVAGYFFEWAFQNPWTINQFICSLAFQMATMMPDYRDALIKKLKDNGRFLPVEHEKTKAVSNLQWFREKTDAELFNMLITDNVLIDGKRDNKIIVIDGVDEAVFEGNNPLAELLRSDAVSRLPSWIKIILTARREEDIRILFQKLEAQELQLDCEQSREDIELYLHYRLDNYINQGILPSDAVVNITQRCENTFIFAEKLCDAYDDDKSVLSDLARLPQTINGLYVSYFDRLFKTQSYEQVRKPLSVLVANNGEISESLFCNILNWSNAQMSQFLFLMRSFIRSVTEGKGRNIVFYHKTVIDWIVDHTVSGMYAIEEQQGRELILDFCEKSLLLLENAPFSWGFDGSKATFPFETLSFIYNKINTFGSTAMKVGLQTNLRFLYELQLGAYQNSELQFSKQVAEEIEDNYSLMSPNEQHTKRKYYAGSVILTAETEIARDNSDALQMFEDAERRFADCLAQEYDLYGSTERNICFLLRKTDLEAAEARLRRLIAFFTDKEYPQKYSDIAHTCYHLCVILYDQKKYTEALVQAERAIKMAHRFNEEPLRLCVLVYNQMGSCYQSLCATADTPEEKQKYVLLQKEIKQKSLDGRLHLYGKYSRYTANAYDYMARALLDACRVLNEPLDPKAYEHVENAIKISSYVLGKQSLLYARALQTKALLLEHEQKIAEAFVFVEQSHKIHLSFGDFEKTAIEKSKVIYERIAAAASV